MKKYVLALDEGTTSTRAILFDRNGVAVSTAQHEFRQIYPKPGWVEHDPMTIFANQYAAMTECIAQSGVSAEEIAAIGITNQRETTVVWEKQTGKPVYNAIVWQCRRTAEHCERLAADGYGDLIAEKTGLRPDAYFSATKICWILDHVEGAREKAERGELLFGTVDTWLMWKLTDGRVHATDRTNASRTMIYNIQTDDWDDELLRILNIPRSMLPQVYSSSEIFGYVDLMGVKVPIGGVAGDQQSALFGQGCFEKGDIKTTYGTGCFLLANTGRERVTSRHGLLTTVAATEKGQGIEYVLEGSVFVGGAVIQWVRDELRLIADAADSEYFAEKVKDTGGVYLVPAFAGMGAPYWDMHARGSIVGITRGTDRGQIIRAALESIAYQVDDVVKAMSADIKVPIGAMKADGGATANRFLMQFQADVANLRVLRAASAEATAFGAAALAGLAVGFFKDKRNILDIQKEDTVFVPHMTAEKREELLAGWHRAVGACRAF